MRMPFRTAKQPVYVVVSSIREAKLRNGCEIEAEIVSVFVSVEKQKRNYMELCNSLIFKCS